jgi:hypothetical protein
MTRFGLDERQNGDAARDVMGVLCRREQKDQHHRDDQRDEAVAT